MALANDPDGVEGLRVRLAEAQAAADFLRSALREAEEREAKAYDRAQKLQARLREALEECADGLYGIHAGLSQARAALRARE